MVIDIQDLLLLDKNEKDLVEFIGKFQYILGKDAQYFFSSTYYPKRIQKLVQSKVLKRYNRHLILSTNGRAYLKSEGKPVITKIEYRKQYAERIKFISHIAAMFHNNKKVTFIPSVQIKDKEAFTEKSRRFIRSTKNRRNRIFNIPYIKRTPTKIYNRNVL